MDAIPLVAFGKGGVYVKIHHIGIIVKDIEKSIKIYTALGFNRMTDVVEDIVQQNKIVFLGFNNSLLKIELIQPMNEQSSVINACVGYHHICFEADSDENIESVFSSMKIGKIFTKPIVAPAIDNRKIFFACLKNGTFIELLLNEGACD